MIGFVDTFDPLLILIRRRATRIYISVCISKRVCLCVCVRARARSTIEPDRASVSLQNACYRICVITYHRPRSTDRIVFPLHRATSITLFAKFCSACAVCARVCQDASVKQEKLIANTLVPSRCSYMHGLSIRICISSAFGWILISQHVVANRFIHFIDCRSRQLFAFRDYTCDYCSAQINVYVKIAEE